MPEPLHLAALAAGRHLRYATLCGEVAALVATGRLVRTGDVLDRLGADGLNPDDYDDAEAA